VVLSGKPGLRDMGGHSMYLRESRSALRLAKLDDRKRHLWDFMLAGMTLRQIAAELGISYGAVKWEKRKLLRWFKTRLREFLEPVYVMTGGLSSFFWPCAEAGGGTPG